MKKNHFYQRNGYYLSTMLLKACNIALLTAPLFLNAQHKERIKDIQEVELVKRKLEAFESRKLREVEGTSIFAAKKTEVVLMDLKLANKALNNPRQVFSQVSGVNVFDSNDGGLQLNIGGRGLNPNRSANFNTRQNGYDISADVLGYPESYYTPPAEALEEIQVVRGAASLQYGTQFGGLLNFKLKTPTKTQPLELVSRNTYASFNTYTSFNALSGTVGKWSYYTFFNYKQGDGFQENSEYNARNFYVHLNYEITPQTSISTEFTRFNYLAHQPGGLTDFQFYQNPYQSNRARNWFKVDWNLWNVSLKHQFTPRAKLSLSGFGLGASRYSLGYRPPRVADVDYEGATRDLITGDFKNWGVEARFLQQYGNKNHTFLVGGKYYKAQNSGKQGPGSAFSGADFNFDQTNKNYFFQSDYSYPNRNIAVFSENIFKLGASWSVVPGVRWEFIDTGADGAYQRVIEDNAGNVIYNKRFEEQEKRQRNFALFGLGVSYKPTKAFEFYTNLSQNYRSVTFSDIRVENNSQVIDPNIKDETGYTGDLGIRGNWKNTLSYDINMFGLWYNNRIDNVFRKREGLFSDVAKVRTNVGAAFIAGLESLVDVNINKLLLGNLQHWKWNLFFNTALTHSQYVKSEIPGIKGNRVEYVPKVNLKSGLNFGYRNFLGSLLFTYMSEQFTTATNEPTDKTDHLWGIRGSIPAYKLLDASFSYCITPNLRLETGVNNVLNEVYFTRRATGYPGPGIIPSAPRQYYFTLEMKL
ncbi:TonB-dependent receptor [Riemerella anatipestifer]|nr:TonB-dependent receptor [Riemerella anatipestifer]MDY3497004.1 TonB-dependent receptor [Riemerella anatipestifer]